jgi:flagellar basal-body rod protein FlgB
VDAISSIIINKALDGLSMRAVATAQNIAGASSPNYQPLQVKFEDSLKAAAARGSDAVRALPLAITRAEQTGFGDEPRLDLELSTAAATASRYGALINLLGRELQIDRLAIEGGQS